MVLEKYDELVSYVKTDVPENFFEIFGGEKSGNIIKQINDQVLELRSEVTVLKREMGA